MVKSRATEISDVKSSPTVNMDRIIFCFLPPLISCMRKHLDARVGFASLCFFVYISMSEYAVGWLCAQEKHLLMYR